MSNRRRMARRISRSMVGDAKHLRIGGGLVWPIHAAFAVAVMVGLYFGLKPLIGGFAILVAAMVLLVLGACWVK